MDQHKHVMLEKYPRQEEKPSGTLQSAITMQKRFAIIYM